MSEFSPPGFYVVRHGDHVARIAALYGLDPVDVWEHANNEALRKSRHNMSVLLAGDQLFVPEMRHGEISVNTGARHRVVARIPTAELKVRLRIDDRSPLAREGYRLSFSSGDQERVIEGVTDDAGMVVTRIPVKVRHAMLLVPRYKLKLRLAIGDLDPHADQATNEPITTGVQARLNNLGFHAGPIDGVFGPETESAVKSFQREVLGREEPTGQLDSETLGALKDEHGS